VRDHPPTYRPAAYRSRHRPAVWISANTIRRGRPAVLEAFAMSGDPTGAIVPISATANGTPMNIIIALRRIHGEPRLLVNWIGWPDSVLCC